MLVLAASLIAVKGVTVRFAALPLPLAMERLSAATGKRLEAAPALREEVLLARVRDVPVDEVLRRVADAMEAEWVIKPDGTVVLRPDPVKRRRRVAAERAADVETLRNSLGYVAKRLSEQPEILTLADIQATQKKREREEARRKAAEQAGNIDFMLVASSADEETPAWRCLARILPLLGEATFLEIQSDGRIVWAERPTRTQRAFPSSATDVLRRYRSELAVAKPGTEPSRVRLVVKRWETGARFNATLQAVGVRGEVVDTAFGRLADDMEILKRPGGHKTRLPPAGNERPLALSPDAIEHRALLSVEGLVSDPERARLRAKWRSILLDPVRHDPLSWLPGEGLVAAAEALDKNVVGTVADLLGLRYDDPPKGETPSQFLARQRNAVESVGDRWIVLRRSTEVSRVPRAVGRDFLREAVRTGGVTLDGAAAFVAASPDRWPFLNWVGDHLGALFPGRGPYSARAAISDEVGLRLWHSLGEGNRQALRSGQSLRLSNLPIATRERLKSIVFDMEGIEGEPTERMPNGLTEAEVALKTEETTIFTSWESKQEEPSEPMPLTAADFGRALANGIPYWSETAEAIRRRDRFRLGLRRVYRLTFAFTGGESVVQELAEVILEPNRPPTDRLPDAILKEVEAARQKALAQPARPKPNQDPPPPHGVRALASSLDGSR